MAKRWIDGNKISEVTEMPEDLYRYEDLMKSVPNFDKSKEKVKRKNNKKFKYRK